MRDSCEGRGSSENILQVGKQPIPILRKQADIRCNTTKHTTEDRAPVKKALYRNQK